MRTKSKKRPNKQKRSEAGTKAWETRQRLQRHLSTMTLPPSCLTSQDLVSIVSNLKNLEEQIVNLSRS